MRRAGAAVGESAEETRLGHALGAAGFTNKQLPENTAQREERRVTCLQNWKMEEPHCSALSWSEVSAHHSPTCSPAKSPWGSARRLVSVRTAIQLPSGHYFCGGSTRPLTAHTAASLLLPLSPTYPGDYSQVNLPKNAALITSVFQSKPKSSSLVPEAAQDIPAPHLLDPIPWHSLHPVQSRGCINICSVNAPLCHQVQILSYAIKAAQWN